MLFAYKHIKSFTLNALINNDGRHSTQWLRHIVAHMVWDMTGNGQIPGLSAENSISYVSPDATSIVFFIGLFPK